MMVEVLQLEHCSLLNYTMHEALLSQLERRQNEFAAQILAILCRRASVSFAKR